MKTLAAIFGLYAIAATAASAEWCDPPIAPTPTTPELAKDFREEFKAEFDQYFRDAPQYVACLDRERTRIFDEMEFTVQRYDRFLSDKNQWDSTE